MDLLSLIVFLPLIAAILLLLVPKNQLAVFRWGTLLIMVVDFFISLRLLPRFESIAEMQMIVQKAWVPVFGVEYHLGVDGISLFLVLLTTFLAPLVVLSTFSSVRERVKQFYLMLLILQTGMLGAFVALDLFLFYVFWELMLLPMYLLIGVWGGPRRIYAAVKFVLYTIVGSLLMLVAILWIYFEHHAQTGVYTFNLLSLYNTVLTPDKQIWLFAAFGLAFAIKVPMFPFHTWLPDAHVEAPTAGSVVLAGVLLKMGTYGFLRFAVPLFPDAAVTFQPWILTLAVIGIIYGALVAMVQKDIKKLVAYSSVSHLGYVMLGIFSFNLFGFSGGLYQMLVLGAIYMLWLVKRFLFGELVHEENRSVKDLNLREGWVLIPILIMIVYMGVQPKPFLSRMEPSLNATLETLRPAIERAALEEKGNSPELDLSSTGLEVPSGELEGDVVEVVR